MSGLDPTGISKSAGWNYHTPDKEGYSTELVGTVLTAQLTQAMKFGNDGKPSTPKFWENDDGSMGNPVMNLRLGLTTPEGEFVTFTFPKAGKAQREGKKYSLHMEFFRLSGGVKFTDVIGKTFKITTVEGFYGKGHPRPWTVELLTDQGPFEYPGEIDPIYMVPEVLADTAASGGQRTAPPQQQARQAPPQYAPAPIQQAPVYQQPPVQGYVPQYAPAPQQYAQAPMQQQVQQAFPGAVVMPYDEDIPF